MQRKCSITYLSRRPVASFSLCIALVLVIQILIIFSWKSADTDQLDGESDNGNKDDRAGSLPAVVKFRGSDGRILGLDPKLQSSYKIGPDGLFSCLDQSQTVPAGVLNEDYCDCQDGSDEPSTSACPDQKFHCPQSTIPSSRGVAHTIKSSSLN